MGRHRARRRSGGPRVTTPMKHRRMRLPNFINVVHVIAPPLCFCGCNYKVALLDVRIGAQTVRNRLMSGRQCTYVTIELSSRTPTQVLDWPAKLERARQERTQACVQEWGNSLVYIIRRYTMQVNEAVLSCCISSHGGHTRY